MTFKLRLFAVAIGVMIAASVANDATAGVIYSANFNNYDFGTTYPGIDTNPGSLAATFSADAGSGSISFEVAAYGTLDGPDNPSNSDFFHFYLNGNLLFAGSWGLGGGGGTGGIIFNPNGGTATVQASPYAISAVPTRQRITVSWTYQFRSRW